MGAAGRLAAYVAEQAGAALRAVGGGAAASGEDREAARAVLGATGAVLNLLFLAPRAAGDCVKLLPVAVAWLVTTARAAPAAAGADTDTRELPAQLRLNAAALAGALLAHAPRAAISSALTGGALRRAAEETATAVAQGLAALAAGDESVEDLCSLALGGTAAAHVCCAPQTHRVWCVGLSLAVGKTPEVAAAVFGGDVLARAAAVALRETGVGEEIRFVARKCVPAAS
jgi:hypothetical protein